MEKNNKKPLENRRRTLSRLIAIQIYYQYEFFQKKQEIHNVKDDLIDNYVLFEGEEPQSYRQKIDESFIDDLIESMEEEIVAIDENIAILQKNSKEIDDVMKQLIRFAALELKIATDTDFKIIINEYVDIAAHFFSQTKLAFINSILNNLAKQYRGL